jgi:DNA primase
VYTRNNGAASVFEVLREDIAIERLIKTNGLCKGLCIAHSEKTPSMHVYDDHVHCFSCGFHGDVVDVWSVQRGIEPPIEAALDLAREFGIQLPEMSKEGRQKVEERRAKEETQQIGAWSSHEILVGSHDGQPTRAPVVRRWWEERGFGEELQKRFLLGANKADDTATIPLWHRGRVLGLIHRKLQGEPKYRLPNVEEFTGGYKPLFIPGPIKGETFLTESYPDALAVVATGRSAIAVGGTEISDAQRQELRRVVPEGATLYILPHADESGAVAARAWGANFFPAARVCQPHYEGGNDIADAFAALGPKKTADLLDRLAATSKDMIDIETEVAAELEGGPRNRAAYAMERIVPLLAKIKDEVLRDATADIVADQVKGLKKSWLNKGIKAEADRNFAQELQAVMAKAEAEAAQRAEEHQQKIADAQPEIDALFDPGVLGRLCDTAAAMHNVYGDREPLELALLVALGAQLDPLPNGRPLGASILLTAQAGRGKNHIVDAAVKPLPEEFYFAFEIASGQSLYYKADQDPQFLKHTFAYPNEIEGAEQLWEFLRPMLSKGRAHKIVTAKDADGNMTTREITVEGPVTIAIPTIRNKTDEQLQTRLLVAELADYPGRIKEHSAAVSAQLLPDAATKDYSREVFLWQEGLRRLTGIRRVVFPLKHRDFALDDDQISHGARLWANLLSLMVSHAWLEQKNRRILQLQDGVVAIEATPDDYEAAYLIFNAVCKRTVVNLSDAHRKILGGLYDLHEEFPHREGFTHREIARQGGVSTSTVSDNRTYLIMSAKFIKETDAGLALVEGAEPSWWATGELMQGLPTPEQVRAWWNERDPDPPEGADHADQPITDAGQEQNHDTYADSGDRHPTDRAPITTEGTDRDRLPIGELPIGENCSHMGNGTSENGSDRLIGVIGNGRAASSRRLTDEELERVKRYIGEGMSARQARAEVLKESPF